MVIVASFTALCIASEACPEASKGRTLVRLGLWAACTCAGCKLGTPTTAENDLVELRLSVFVVKLLLLPALVLDVLSRLPCSICISSSSAVALLSLKLSSTFLDCDARLTISLYVRTLMVVRSPGYNEKVFTMRPAP